VGWRPVGRRCSWWPTGAAPASLMPVVAVVFYLRFVRCHNKRIFIYLFIYFYANTDTATAGFCRNAHRPTTFYLSALHCRSQCVCELSGTVLLFVYLLMFL